MEKGTKMVQSAIDNKSILITGGTGSWGNELTSQLLTKYCPKSIIIFSRGEQKQVEMRRKIHDTRVKYVIGDIRDKDRLRLITKEVDTIFHLAALKHVPVCEENAWETVQTNVIGIQNLIDAAIENGVERVIDISTDKAVDPFNLYGVTKACGEKLMIAANLIGNKTKFACIRGGNVLGTTGSVVPLFRSQILERNEITITDPTMTRFFMKVQDAIGLVLYATEQAAGGEIFVMKMSSVTIENLAQVMINNLGNSNTKITITGIRPGEKLSEVLVSKYEIPRTLDTDQYYIILPQLNITAIEKRYGKNPTNVCTLNEYSSTNSTTYSKSELTSLLMSDGWLDHNERIEPLVEPSPNIAKTQLTLAKALASKNP